MKRAFDIALALLLIPVVLPLVALCAIVIRMDSPAPVFHISRRVGRKNRIFNMPKFRTMLVSTPQVATHLLVNPSNHLTRAGGFLRKTSLDELPQLFNVLLSEMSLVGPRPIVQEELQKYGLEKSYYLMVRPGMTGLWQVSGRNDVDYETRVYLDAWYVKNWSLWYDLAILFKTVKVVFWRNGAY